MDITPGIFAILNQESVIVGTGFLISGQYGVTCAHVIVAADAVDGDTVQVRFSGQTEKINALVMPEFWRNANKGDVAILKLDSVPDGVRLLRLAPAADCRPGSSFRSFGYAIAADVQGIIADGTIDGYLPEHRLLQLLCSQANHGISGAPVLDESRDVVVGMITSGHTKPGRNANTTFATPSELLFEIYPELFPSEICPYLGLEIFTAETAKFFFGREALTRKLLGVLRGGYRFLALFGPSGSGKSSVVSAGLLPALEQGQLPGGLKWIQVTMRPAEDPFAQMNAAGLESLDNLTKRVILFIDQFEELFTLCPDELCRKFIQELAVALENSRFMLVISMRDDFYSAFNARAALLAQSDHLKIENVPGIINQDELVAMIQKPAAVAGLEIEAGLTELILKDLTRDGEARSSILPLLEFTLMQLWEKRRNRLLTHAAYKSIGEVTGSLALWADKAYSDLAISDQPLAESLLTSLVYLGDETVGRPDTRRWRMIAEFDKPTQLLVEHFANRRLIVTSSGTIELIHEALLREWGRLQSWLKRDRYYLKINDDLESAAKKWIDNNKQTGFLFQRAQLDQVLETIDKLALKPAQPVQDFLNACLEKKKKNENSQLRLKVAIMLGTLFIVTILVAWGLTSSKSANDLAYQVAIATSALGVAQYQQATAQAAQQTAVIAQETAQIGATEAVEAQNTAISAKQTVEALWGSSNLSQRKFQAIELSSRARDLINQSYNKAILLGIEGLRQNEFNQTIIPMFEIVQAHPGLEQFLIGHANRVNVLALNSDQTILASGGDDKNLYFWKFNKTSNIWEPYKLPDQSPDPITALAFSPDGKTIASGSNNQEIILWDVGDPGKPRKLASLYDSQAHITALSFEKVDNRILLASASGYGHIILWDLTNPQSAQKIKMLSGIQTEGITSIAFSPDGRTLASGGADGSLSFWFIAGNPVYSWELLTNRPLRMHASAITSLAFNPIGTFNKNLMLASSSKDNAVLLWSINQPIGASPNDNLLPAVLIKLESHKDVVNQVIFSQDGKTLISSGNDHKIFLWNVPVRVDYEPKWKFEPREITMLNTDENTDVTSLALTSNGELFSGLSDGKIARWNIDDAVNKKSLLQIAREFSEGPTQRIPYIPSDGQVFYPAIENDQIEPSSVFTIQASSKLIATAYEKQIKLWDISNPQGKAILLSKFGSDRHSNEIESLAISPDGRFLASGSRDTTTILWDIDDSSSPKFISQLIGQFTEISNLVFTYRRGELLLATAGNGKIIIWNISPQNEVNKITEIQSVNSYTGLRFNKNGNLLVTGAGNGVLEIWDMTRSILKPEKRKTIETFGKITSLEFDDEIDKTLLVAGYDNGTIILWNLSNLDIPVQIAQLLGPQTDEITFLVFDKAGSSLISADKDGSTVTWDLDWNRWLTKACKIAGQNLTKAEWEQYVRIEAYRATCQQWPLDVEPTTTFSP